jgi:hypothetical protein
MKNLENNSEINCATIRDLLPLYHDNVCSEQSRLIVAQHLENCSECALLLNEIAENLMRPVNKVNEEKPIRAMKSLMRRGRVLAFTAGCVIAALIYAVTLSVLIQAHVSNAIESNFQYVGDGTLREGRYFLNGDVNGLYYEVFEDGTMKHSQNSERFSYVVVSHSLTYRGFISRYIGDEPDSAPQRSSWFLYRAASIEEVRDFNPGDISSFHYAEVVNGSNAFIVFTDVWVRVD